MITEYDETVYLENLSFVEFTPAVLSTTEKAAAEAKHLDEKPVAEVKRQLSMSVEKAAAHEVGFIENPLFVFLYVHIRMHVQAELKDAPATAESVVESGFAATAEEEERTLNVARKVHTADLCQAEAYDYISPCGNGVCRHVCIDMPSPLNHYTPTAVFPLPFNLTTTLRFILIAIGYVTSRNFLLDFFL